MNIGRRRCVRAAARVVQHAVGPGSVRRLAFDDGERVGQRDHARRDHSDAAPAIVTVVLERHVSERSRLWRLRSRCARLRTRACGAPDPLARRQQRHTRNAAFDPPARRVRRCRLHGSAHRRRLRAAPLIDRHPPRQKGKHFGSAYRAFLGIVDFFAVEAYARNAQLHDVSVT